MSRIILKVENLSVASEDKVILQGLNLVIKEGEIHALMGPNGSGKSTLSHALMGHPRYQIKQGSVIFKDQDITSWSPQQRARAGIFLGFQYPVAVEGVSVKQFCRQMLKARRGQEIKASDFRQELKKAFEALQVPADFASRFVNHGFSGGEKKRLEILQMALFKPELALLDEIDSGLDIDALRTVCEGINSVLKPPASALIVTHYQRMLEYIKPGFVHVLARGAIRESGDWDLVLRLEKEGYDRFL
jgi:Fe-S cluster assembly ATP-binding protein